jgi:hypothetical protein
MHIAHAFSQFTFSFTAAGSAAAAAAGRTLDKNPAKNRYIYLLVPAYHMHNIA